jgi:hypothetical protein
MPLKIKEPAKKLSLAEIRIFAEQLGIPPLPEDYMEFLMLNNGGIPSPDTYMIPNHPEGLCDIQVFFGIGRDIEADCLDWNFYECTLVPEPLFPIGNSSTDDLICLSLSGETRGGIFFWDDMVELTEFPSFANVYKIADSFTEFVENLSEYTVVKRKVRPLQIDKPAKPLSLEEIRIFTEQLGIPTLPEDYVEFLRLNNGGIPSFDTYMIPSRGYHSEDDSYIEAVFGDIQEFFGIGRDSEVSCLDWHFYEYQTRIPSTLFPIGKSSTNDLICLSLSGETRGGVFFWEALAETAFPSFANVYKIAGSFTEFLDDLFKPVKGVTKPT